MNSPSSLTNTIPKDLIAGVVVFLVALPLCLGIALASNAPLFSGILAGIIGGVIVGALSGSNTSVSGPAAGLSAVVASQIAQLESFEAFLTALVLAGLIQIAFGISRLGFIAAFFPSSVIKGLLSAIGIILILKQIPHLLGHDLDPIGDDSFLQIDNNNTFTELFAAGLDIHAGPALIGLFSLLLLFAWDRVKFLKNTQIPAPLVVVIFGIISAHFLAMTDPFWMVKSNHLVQVPLINAGKNLSSYLIFPDFSVLKNLAVYLAAITIAIVASLETLLNLEAIDKIDPMQRNSPPNRELFAQGVGNMCAGLIGGLPVTSVIVRSSVNLNAGVQTKLSTVWHGLLLLVSILLIPDWLNKIPLSALAAILLFTGLKLVSPQLIAHMWREGKNQFLPFAITIIAIIFTDLLVGVLIGLAIAIGFILHSNTRRPLKKIMEKHATGDEVLHIELPNQMSFFNRASFDSTLQKIKPGGHVLIDATNTDYIDPDILDLIDDFQNNTAKVYQIKVSLQGFKDKYPKLEDRIQYIDFSYRELQDSLTPERVLEILQEGNLRFRSGMRLTRHLERLLNVTAEGQFPMAVVLSCIDSRASAELIFDLSLGDIFNVRIAGNILSHKVLGSIEYSCAVAGAKLILVMGHTSCGAVRAAVDLMSNSQSVKEVTQCDNLDYLIADIQKSINKQSYTDFKHWSATEKQDYADGIAYKNVLRTMHEIRQQSSIINELVASGRVAIVGAMYDISNAKVSFFQAINIDN